MLIETGKLCDNISVTKNGLVSGVDRIFKSSVSAFKHITDPLYPLRKSSTFSFFAHRLEYASHASMQLSSSGAMKMKQVLYISVPCVKDFVVCHSVRYWDLLSLSCHIEYKETQNQSRNKVRDSEKDLLQTCFVVENVGSNRTCIAIRNAWRLKVWRNIDGHSFSSSTPIWILLHISTHKEYTRWSTLRFPIGKKDHRSYVSKMNVLWEYLRKNCQ